MTRRTWLLIHLGLSVLAVASGLVFALGGCHPAWMMATFILTMSAVISGALYISSP